VLVVDDEKSWRGIFSRWLEPRYEVLTAESLEQALEVLEKRGPFAVVITDIGLSRVETNDDGFIILQTVYERWPMTRTIAVSGQPREVDPQQIQDHYHALAYLDRGMLRTDRETFLKLVDEGVRLSRGTPSEE